MPGMRQTRERIFDRDTVKRFLVAASIGSIVLCSCAAPPIVVATAGASIAQIGGTAYANGVLESAFESLFDDLVCASERVITSSGLLVRRTRPRNGYKYIETVDKTNTTIVFRIERRTPRIAVVRIRVGTFGNQPLSTLFMRMIEKELERSKAPSDP